MLQYPIFISVSVYCTQKGAYGYRGSAKVPTSLHHFPWETTFTVKWSQSPNNTQKAQRQWMQTWCPSLVKAYGRTQWKRGTMTKGQPRRARSCKHSSALSLSLSLIFCRTVLSADHVSMLWVVVVAASPFSGQNQALGKGGRSYVRYIERVKRVVAVGQEERHWISLSLLLSLRLWSDPPQGSRWAGAGVVRALTHSPHSLSGPLEKVKKGPMQHFWWCGGLTYQWHLIDPCPPPPPQICSISIHQSILLTNHIFILIYIYIYTNSSISLSMWKWLSYW